MEGETLYLQLEKLSSIKSSEALEEILTTLWNTRKSGLQPPQKSQIQSLLNLPSPSHLDPVLACLRSFIRKCVRENLTSDDLLKLFPPHLSLDVQTLLVLLLQKHQNHWKDQLSEEQAQAIQQAVPRMSVSYNVKTSLPPSFTSFPSSVISTPLWPHQDDPVTNFNHNDLGASTPVVADNTVTCLSPMLLQHDVSHPNNLRNLPSLKSMTWTMEKSKSAPGDRVAVISLKLQDHTKSPSGEIEVKFQLTKDTLEAMLTSMAYISEQLSTAAGTSSGPALKKQKQ